MKFCTMQGFPIVQYHTHTHTHTFLHVTTEGQQGSSGSTSKVDLVQQELDRYKQMTEREKRELDHERQPLNPTTNQAPPTTRPLPIPAKPVATLLSMWTAKEHHKASTSHVEFAEETLGREQNSISSWKTMQGIITYRWYCKKVMIWSVILMKIKLQEMYLIV